MHMLVFLGIIIYRTTYVLYLVLFVALTWLFCSTLRIHYYILWREEFNADDDDPAWTDESFYVSIYVLPLDLDIDVIYSFSTRILSKCSDHYQTNVSLMISLQYHLIRHI